jgi:hypothetical protein
MLGSWVSQAVKTRLTTIAIGLLGMSVYKEVQYEAQVNHLRHARFVALREDKAHILVVRESP